jgi:YidC/Oxa1 family membrane protein insertase
MKREKVYMSTILQPVTGALNALLSICHSLTHDWGLAVVLLTLLIRISLFVFNVKSARQQIKQARMRPLLEELRTQFAADTQKLASETMKLYGKLGIKPFSMLTISLVQAPIFMALYSLFQSHGSTMTSGMIPWVSSLGQFDPMHIVPVLYALITLVSMLIPLTSEIVMAGSFLKHAGRHRWNAAIIEV